MKRVYDTGSDTNLIDMGVTAGTVGTAYTAVYLVRSGGQFSKLQESNEDSGNIPASSIGSALELRKSYLVIRTLIDLSNIDKDLWKNQQDNLVMRYFLKGGFSGSQIYNQDIDDVTASPSGKILSVTKAIELV